ncbi:hypothetical protein KC332_g6482, partial [Hortaea werneckii]
MSDDRTPKQRREELQKRADSAQESHRNGTLNGTPNGTPRGGPTERFEGHQDDEQTDENVFLFVPNLIGYLRIVLALASLYFMPLHPRRCSFLYSVSCLLDALDGVAARKFKQSTRFGAVLDMVTDRCTTTCLLVFLATAKPAYSIIFQGLISLDLASHYMHMYATLAMGGQGESHKNVRASRSWIMNKYYSNKTMLFVCCALNELFFIALYLLCFSSPRITPALLPSAGLDINGTTPTTPHQPTPSLLFPSPFSAAAMEMARANKMDSFVPWVLTLVSLPVMLLKQYINVEQLVKASQWLAEGDRKDRSKAIREGRLKKGEFYKGWQEVFRQRNWIDVLHSLHEQYGDVVRVGPNDLHFSAPAAYHDIYNNANRWDKEGRLYRSFGEDRSSFGFLTYMEAKSRKDVLAPLFSRRAISDLQHLIQKHADRLCDALAKENAAGKSSDMLFALRCFTLDTILSYCFAKDVHAMETEDFQAPIVVAMDASLASFIVFRHFETLRKVVFSLPGWLTRLTSPALAGLVDLQELLGAQVKEVVAHPESLKLASHPIIYHRLQDPELSKAAGGLPSPESLYEEAQALLFGGADSAGNTTMIGLYYVLSDTVIKDRLKAEICSVWPDIGARPPRLEELEKLPYLSAIVKESLRMAPGVPSPLPRAVPRTGATIGSHFVPPSTIVGMSPMFVHFSSSHFPRPYRFDPERWLQPDSVALDKWLVPFSRGPRACLGQNLGLCELYIAFANVVRSERAAKLAPVREVVERITIPTISRAFSFPLKRPIQAPWISSTLRYFSANSVLQSHPNDEPQPRDLSRTVSQIKDLLNLGGSQAAPNTPREAPATKYSASIEPRVFRYEQRSNPTDQWRRRNVLGTRKDESKVDIETRNGKAEIVLKDIHQARLLPPYQDFYRNERRFDTVGHRPMRSYVQILTTPTADSPGTTLVLHFDNKRYLIGSLAEGTQRACVQMGARLLKVSECFITGRTEWRNTGGLIGMILTLADAASSSAAASADDAKKRAQAKGKRLGVSHDKEKMKALEEEAKKDVANRKLTLFSG